MLNMQLFKTLLVASSVEKVRSCPKGPNPVPFSASFDTVLCAITKLLLHKVILEKEKDQMLHLGHEDGTDCFQALFQTKGMRVGGS